MVNVDERGTSEEPPRNDAVDQRSQIDQRLNTWNHRLAGPMFVLSLVFLVLVYYAVRAAFGHGGIEVLLWCAGGIGVLYPIFIGEVLLYRRWGSPAGDWYRRCAIWPPLRLAGRDAATGQQVWIPGLGWSPAGIELSEMLEKVTTVILFVTGLGLGAFALALYGRDQTFDGLPETTVFKVAVLFVWLVIVVELVLQESLARSRWRFLRSHRINVIVSFTPMLTVLRVALIVRVFRGALQFESVQKLFYRTPERRLAALEEELSIKQDELKRLQERIRDERLKLAAGDSRSTDPAAETTNGVPIDAESPSSTKCEASPPGPAG